MGGRVLYDPYLFFRFHTSIIRSACTNHEAKKASCKHGSIVTNDTKNYCQIDDQSPKLEHVLFDPFRAADCQTELLIRAKTLLEKTSSAQPTLEMATAQRTRPRAVVGAPRRAAWQLKSALRHSISSAPRTIIFLHFF